MKLKNSIKSHSLSQHFTMLDDKSLILTYEGAGECKHNKDSVVRVSLALIYSCTIFTLTSAWWYLFSSVFTSLSQIEITCKPGDYSSTPLLISSSSCDYLFSWSTAAACPAHDVTG